MVKTAKPGLSLKGRGLQLLAQREQSRVELRRKLLAHARAEQAAWQAALAGDDPASESASRKPGLNHVSPAARRQAQSASVSGLDVPAGAECEPEPPQLDGLPAGLRRASSLPFREEGAPILRRGQARPTLRNEVPQPVPSSDEAADTVADETAEARVEAVLDWLQAQRFLSEERFVESRVNARRARFGGLRIRQELAQHGLTLSAADSQSLKDSEGARAREVWLRKFGQPPADAAERGKQMRFLAGRGFSGEVIRKVVSGGFDDEGEG